MDSRGTELRERASFRLRGLGNVSVNVGLGKGALPR
jgi:hypothetical protein